MPHQLVHGPSVHCPPLDHSPHPFPGRPCPNGPQPPLLFGFQPPGPPGPQGPPVVMLCHDPAPVGKPFALHHDAAEVRSVGMGCAAVKEDQSEVAVGQAVMDSALVQEVKAE